MPAVFLGQIKLVPYDFAPQGWAFCHGQLLGVRRFEALYRLLGNRYGGEKDKTFALPDLRGRVPLGAGAGGGLGMDRRLGDTGGENVTRLRPEELPGHTHTVVGCEGPPDAARADSALLGQGGRQLYCGLDGDAESRKVSMAPCLSSAGGADGHPNLQPYLALNYIISLSDGVYPG